VNASPGKLALRGSIMQHFLEEVVPQRRGKVASADDTLQLTFDDLARASLNLADRLDAIAPPGRPVGLLMSNGALIPVATLACLASGRPYIPIDPNYPAAHIEAVLRDAGVGAIVTAKPSPALSAELPPLPAADAMTALRAGDAPRRTQLPASGPAAILYTSGSTGRPKGACHDQQTILERVATATEMMRASDQDHFALLGSPTIISALYIPFTSLLLGATLFFADARRLGISKTIQFLRERRITATYIVPALLRELLGAPGAKEAFSHFRAIRTGGDVVIARDMGLWRSVLPPTCRVWISLSSTEMPAVFQWIVPRDWEPDGARLPVGYARPQDPFVIVDDNGDPVADGETGELIIKSRNLALGYWQDGALKPFATDPDDPSVRIFPSGDLVRVRGDRLTEMVGRKDRQVKIRGFRVNLGEVEGVIRNCPGVAAAAVVARRQGEEVRALVAYVEPDKSAPVDVADLKGMLEELLPPQMRPSRIHFLDAIPLLPGFKVDVKALLSIDQQYAAPGTSPDIDRHARNGDLAARPQAIDLTAASTRRVHAATRQAWVTILDERSFDANVPFEEAGGDSLAALHLWSLIEHALKAELSFDNLRLDMTPRTLTESIEKQLTRSKPGNGAGASTPLLFYFPTAEGDTFLQAQLRAGMSADVRCEIVRYPSALDFLESEAKFEALVDASVRQIAEHTDQPCNIVGYSFGGFVAWATACRLKELGRPLNLVGLIDARRMRAGMVQTNVRRLLLEPRYAVDRAVRGGLRLTVETGYFPLLRSFHKATSMLPPKAAFRTHLHLIEQLRMYACRRWAPAVLDHPVCLFRSDELPDSPDFGWGKLCPRLEIVPIGGTHDSLLYPPDRDVLCEKIVGKLQSSPDTPMVERIGACARLGLADAIAKEDDPVSRLDLR